MEDSSDGFSSSGEGTSIAVQQNTLSLESSTKKKKKYAQHHKSEWEEIELFKPWLKSSKKGREYSFCKSCNKDINIAAGKDTLIRHANTKMHEEKSKVISKQPSLLESFASNKSQENTKQGEVRMAAYIAEHNLAFLNLDHLTKLIKSVCTDSKIAEGLSCNRTKGTQIVKNVIGEYGFEKLCDDLRNTKFSLIVDESTDLCTKKHLCLVVRYLKDGTIRDSFLTLIPLREANADTLYNHIVNFFDKYGIPYKTNLIGFASDGANVMMGVNHSLMTLLKNDIPNLFTLKCTCHSFHLCASYACEKIPRIVEGLTRDIYNYFNSSPKRVAEFVEFQQFCNVKVHKMLQPGQTRWLSLHSVVKRVLEQYDALKLYFTDAVLANDILAANDILQKLNDPTCKLFLQFLDFALPIFTNLNKEMQSEKPKIHTLFKRVRGALKMILDCFIKREYLQTRELEDIDFKNPRNFMSIDNMYCGASVALTLNSETLEIPANIVEFFKLRCLEFYIEACTQICKRFPLANNDLKHFEIIDPENVKRGTNPTIAHLASVHILPSNIQVADNEWRQLRNTDEINTFDNDVELFWKQVQNIKRGDGESMFPVISELAFKILSLPHSSANVERIFSSVNLMKTKQRNRLSTTTIEGLLHTKSFIDTKTCYNFNVPTHMLAKLNSFNLYKNKDDD